MKKRNKYRLGRTSLRRRSDVSLYLVIASNRAILCSPVDFGVPLHGGAREDQEQNDIFKLGYSRADGFIKKSYHQIRDARGRGKALDLVPYIPGKGFEYTAYGRFGVIGMLMLEAWEELQDEGLIPKDIYLHWGGLWTSRDGKKLGWDMAHYEIRNYPQKERL